MAIFHYALSCVGLRHPDDIDALQTMIDRSRPITYDTFKKHCLWQPLALRLGYRIQGRGMRLRDDGYVQYRRSKWKGQWCYYLVHSATEYVFLPDSRLALQRKP